MCATSSSQVETWDTSIETIPGSNSRRRMGVNSKAVLLLYRVSSRINSRSSLRVHVGRSSIKPDPRSPQRRNSNPKLVRGRSPRQNRRRKRIHERCQRTLGHTHDRKQQTKTAPPTICGCLAEASCLLCRPLPLVPGLLFKNLHLRLSLHH